MKKNSLTPVVAFIVIAAGAFMVGRLTSPGPSNINQDQTGGASSPRSSRDLPLQTDATTRRSSNRADRGDSPVSPKSLARLGLILRSEDPLDRNRALFGFIDRLGPDDFATAVEYFRSLGLAESRMGEYALLLSAWAKMDPLSALEFAKASPDRQFAAATVLATWASRDPDAALLWAQTHHEGNGPNPYLSGVIRGIAENDPERAAGLLAEMPKGSERDEALSGVLPQLLAQGGDVARSWIEGLTDDALRDVAMKISAEYLAADDPAGIAKWLQEHPGDASQHRMDNVYDKWARINQQAALASVDALPAGDDRSNALSGVIGAMATTDPAAALAQIERHPGDVTERVMRSFLWNSLESDPGLAISQIPRIEDEGRRDWWYEKTLKSWLDSDAAAAKAWIQRNPLPQPVLDQLSDRLGGQP